MNNEEEVKKEEDKLEEALKSSSMGTGGYNMIILALIRVVLEKFNINSNKYSKKLIRLTKWLIVLSVVMLLAIIVQIYFQIKLN